MNHEAIEALVVVERKQTALPRFAVVPAALVEPWGLKRETTAIDLSINGQEVERRTIRYWDEERWFISITAADCKRLNIDTGDRVKLVLKVASADLPVELAALLKKSAAARRAWENLTGSQQRMLREVIGQAKQPATRERRARKELLGG